MKRYTQVYTGNGKGKTTAALGLAVRALGNGYHVYIGQFMKGQEYGELRTFAKLDNIIIEIWNRKLYNLQRACTTYRYRKS